MDSNLKNLLGDCRLNHIAVATSSIEDSVKFYRSLGLDFSSKREIIESQKVRTAFASIDEYAHLELLESTDPEGPIGKFILKKGVGLHHLCFEVKDLSQKVEELKALNIQFLSEKPFIGANNYKVIFIHPKSAGGVLVELCEKVN